MADGLAIRLVASALNASGSIRPCCAISTVISVTLNVVSSWRFWATSASRPRVLRHPGRGGAAIGMAWSGLLANFAAGAFAIVRGVQTATYQRGGCHGTVREIGLFVTAITTADNAHVVGTTRCSRTRSRTFRPILTGGSI